MRVMITATIKTHQGIIIFFNGITSKGISTSASHTASRMDAKWLVNAAMVYIIARNSDGNLYTVKYLSAIIIVTSAPVEKSPILQRNRGSRF
jgi:hypothetical protein